MRRRRTQGITVDQLREELLERLGPYPVSRELLQLEAMAMLDYYSRLSAWSEAA